MKRAIFSVLIILITCLVFQGTAFSDDDDDDDRDRGPGVRASKDIKNSGEIVGAVSFCGTQGTNGATVDLVGESFVAILGASGEFKLRYVPKGTYTLRVRIPGQPDDTQPIPVFKRRVTDLGVISICPDNDGDTFALDVDCNDNNPDIFPGAEELCDGVDNDCDGEVDAPGCNCTDADNDGFFAQNGCGTAVDCNDGSNTINPNASEICDGVDNNCDGASDETFDTNTDPNNCGDCANACGSGQCAGGICLNECGNGIVEPAAGEQCDDGPANNDTTPGACRTNCTVAACGDGVTDTGEQCDSGGETAVCDADCTTASCGDGVVNTTAGEECDDGNTTDGDGCQADCTLAPVTCPGGVPVGGVVPCDGADADACENGTQTCESNGQFGACVETVTDIVEVCNGIDDDCDGQTDESTEAECSPYTCGGSSGCFTVCNPGGSPSGSDSFCAPGFHCEDTTQDDSFCVPDAVCGNGVVESGEQCDGGTCCNPNCTFASSATSCGNQTSNACDSPDTCNGSGACLPNFASQGTECGNGNTCNGAGSCLTSCGSDSQCASGFFCNGSCRPQEPSGASCNRDGECLSGNCAMIFGVGLCQ
jgi:cysteine-rich repeat protein